MGIKRINGKYLINYPDRGIKAVVQVSAVDELIAHLRLAQEFHRTDAPERAGGVRRKKEKVLVPEVPDKKDLKPVFRPRIPSPLEDGTSTEVDIRGWFESTYGGDPVALETAGEALSAFTKVPGIKGKAALPARVAAATRKLRQLASSPKVTWLTYDDAANLVFVAS